MIYIQNKQVLIAGGRENKCIIYNIQKNIFIDWADLNDKHYKPSLFILNNYIKNKGEYIIILSSIYCFSELTLEKIILKELIFLLNIQNGKKYFPNLKEMFIYLIRKYFSYLNV